MKSFHINVVLLLAFAGLLAGCDGGGSKKEAVDGGVDGGSDGGADDQYMDLGEVRDIPVGEDGALEVTVETQSDGERFVLLLVSNSRVPEEEYDYEISVDDVALGEPVTTGPVEEEARGTADGMPAAGYPVVPAGQWQLPAIPKADPPAVGEMVPFTVKGTAGYESIQAEVMLVSDELVIAFDRTTSTGLTVDQIILDEVADNFSQIVLPREREYFGQESDVNADGHITMLFSPLVYDGSGGATAYVYPCDLLAVGTPGCSASNEQELIYMSPPDMLSSYMGSAEAITETVAHEFQHAIYFYRKYMLNDALTESESPYITEGMSAMAQDLSGFQAGNRYVAAAAIEGTDQISMASVLGDITNYDQQKDGIYRGAGYLVLRYLFDLLGGDSVSASGEVEDLGGVSFMRQMSDLGVFGYDGVEQAGGVSADVFIPDMYTAMLLDDRGEGDQSLNSDPRFTFADQWDDPITGNVHGVTMNYDLAGGSWLVRGVSLQQGGADGRVLAGAEYILLEGWSSEEVFVVTGQLEPTAVAVARIIRIN